MRFSTVDGRKARWHVLVVLSLMVVFVNMLSAAVHADQTMTAATQIRYDADSTSETFCKVVGSQNEFGGAISGSGRVKTSGSSATVTSETASSSALAPVSVGDIIFVRPAFPSMLEPFTAGYAAVITAKASSDSITVDPAVDWSAGYQYSWFKTVCGTTIDDGWIDTSNSTRIAMSVFFIQGDADNISWRFWCKQSNLGSVPQIVYPSESDNCGNAGTQASGFCDFATAGATAGFTWEDFGPWAACRIGFKVKTTDALDTTTNLEQVTGSVAVTKGSN